MWLGSTTVLPVYDGPATMTADRCAATEALGVLLDGGILLQWPQRLVEPTARVLRQRPPAMRAAADGYEGIGWRQHGRPASWLAYGRSWGARDE